MAASEVKAFTAYFRNSPANPGPYPPNFPEQLAAYAPGSDFKLGPDMQQNTGHTEWPDGRVHHSGFTTVFPPNTVVRYVHTDGNAYDIDYNSTQEGRSTTAPTYAAITARSYHGGYINVLMMDGSCRTVNNRVTLSVWRAMGTRNGRETETDY